MIKLASTPTAPPQEEIDIQNDYDIEAATPSEPAGIRQQLYTYRTEAIVLVSCTWKKCKLLFLYIFILSLILLTMTVTSVLLYYLYYVSGVGRNKH